MCTVNKNAIWMRFIFMTHHPSNRGIRNMNDHELKGIIEGLLFISGDDGLTIDQLAKMTGTAAWSIEYVLNQLMEDYKEKDRGLMIMKSHQVYHLTTKPEHSQYLKRLLEAPRQTRLSQAALETLAIIAYQQPITRVEIDNIRGVNSDRAIQTLIARSLIEEKGRKDTIGRPILYGTTKEFLAYFGLTSLDELPDLNDFVAESEQIEQEADLFFDRFIDDESLEQPKDDSHKPSS